jgi:hypothetical protein
LRRGRAGDVEAATDVASLLGDADVRIRRKAAETLFELGHAEGGAATAASRLGSEVTEPLRRAREGVAARRRDARRVAHAAMGRLEEVRGELDSMSMGLARRLMPPS